MRYLTVILLLFISSLGLQAQGLGCHNCSKECILENVRYSPEDVTRFNEVMAAIRPDRDLPMGDLVIKVAKLLLETPYVASTLEIDPEMLTINLNKTDCILFVEMCLALSQTVKDDNPDFETYCDYVRQLRYRDGIVDGYASRLHYTSSWAIQAAVRGIMKEVTKECGGVIKNQWFDFMTTHPNLYRQLRENPDLVPAIRETEEKLNTYEYYYIPKADLPNRIQNIKSGDIIGFDDATPGLDIAHVAYACWQDGELTFIHASSKAHKVIINKTPMIEYINGVKGNDGIRVFRLQ
ncbi:MAG: DUF1460 domain-containing protein [Bacteroidales bacterium]|nr:DUF1460 domain-containing protein [Bacteroidales bacterium]MDD3201391.1 DUF1460 domain-containing protein [Bacteroidales bacterium]